jgi:hypothetical protein
MLILMLAATLTVTEPARTSKDALAGERLGLHDASDFRLTTGRCSDCPTPRQALWYFENDLVAVPRDGARQKPSMVWVGSPEIVEHARLEGDTLRTSDGRAQPFSLVPRLDSNRSYYNERTAAFFANRPLRLRGETTGSGFVVRSVWPEDLRLDAASSTPRETKTSALLTANDGGAEAPAQTLVLWQRSPASTSSLAGKPALAFVLSGAQGDDDEAHGGHFAIATGTVGPQGEWHDWMVNNFYNLDSVSEKGIIAARLPMDHYLMDLNSGQSYYRPVYVMALVLREGRAPKQYQHAIDAVYERFYRHEFTYHHSKANCAGISMDALRSLGWRVPRRGPTSYLKATAAYFYVWAKDGSETKGAGTFDYLTQEQTRLLPRAAFEAASDDARALAAGSLGREATAFEQSLRDDLEAIVFIRVPQIPSSRATGSFPVGSFAEYQARVPADTSKWKIVPVDARPFPDALRDGPAPKPYRSAAPLFGTAAVGIAGGTGLVGVRTLRRRFRR